MVATQSGALALAHNIKSLCDDRGMTFRELAEKAGITSVSISRYRSGVRMPSATTLKAMADALNCHMDELMADVDVEVPEEETEVVADAQDAL